MNQAKENEKANDGNTIYQDPNPPAFFKAVNKPFQIIPQKDPDTGRVEFLVSGEGIDGALQELYTNAPVGVLDFIKELRSLRSSIFALKGGQR